MGGREARGTWPDTVSSRTIRRVWRRRHRWIRPSRNLPYFATLTSEPYGARRRLRAGAIAPLEQWAERYPLGKVQRVRPGEYGQLAVLFSPQGLYVSFPNAATPEQTETVAFLGATLVRAQGNS